MKLYNFVVVANCQARPVCSAIELMAMMGCRNVGVIISHLAKNSDAEANMDMLAKADIIFAQAVQNVFPIRHIVTENLKKEFGEKVISWPNMFFTGQSPGLCYVSGAAGKRINGPLHEYQYRPVVESWQRGDTTDDCLRRIQSGADQDSLIRGVEKSFHELKAREHNLDVIISDLIERDWKKNRLFFTFNHPSSNLLIEVARRLMQKAGFPVELKITTEVFGEPLDRILPPISDADADALGLSFDKTLASKGVELNIVEGKVNFGKSRIYSIRELVEESYRALDTQIEMMKEIRLTPA
jgi:hypothetical protein